MIQTASASLYCDPGSIELVSLKISRAEHELNRADSLSVNGDHPSRDPGFDVERGSSTEKSVGQCLQAQQLVQLFETEPLAFIEGNGFFRLMDLQSRLGQSDLARQTYRNWPWEDESLYHFSPWLYIPEEEQSYFYFFVLRLFSEALPEQVGQCIYNPVTTFCDDGWGLENLGSEYTARFPQSEYTEQALAVAKAYRSHVFDHNMHILTFNISKSRKKPLRVYAALSRALRMEKFAVGQDLATIRSIIRDLALRLTKAIEKEPKVATRLPDSFQNLDLDKLVINY